MNKKAVINLIKLIDPIGEYFEQIGGVYAGITTEYRLNYKGKYQKSIIIICPKEYYFNIVSYPNINDNVFWMINTKLNIKFRLMKMAKFEKTRLKHVFINNYNDFSFPTSIELQLLRSNNFITTQPKTESTLLLNNEYVLLNDIIPLVRRIVIE